MNDARRVFVTGGTGYMGQRLIAELLGRGHQVQALAREPSARKLPKGCSVVLGDALDGATYAPRIWPGATFVHLVGVPHPNPGKAEQFRTIDLVAAHEAIAAAVQARAEHFVYVSVAQPAPVMKPYQAVRAECEQMIQERGLNATIIRPWYVLGPGHRWPYLLIPLYWVLERVPKTREGAQRLGLVTLKEMISALASAVENPPAGVRVIGVPQIRRRA